MIKFKDGVYKCRKTYKGTDLCYKLTKSQNYYIYKNPFSTTNKVLLTVTASRSEKRFGSIKMDVFHEHFEPEHKKFDEALETLLND